MVRSLKLVSDVLASYGLACLLLINLFLLTLFGTFEQMDLGLYDVQKRYFESWFVRHDLGPIPLFMPGGALCMGLLALNLLFGGLVRIRKSWRTAGVIVIHIGIVVMLLAGLVKLKLSDDGYLRLFETQSADEFVSYYLWEVAIFDAAAQEEVREFVIPAEHLDDLQGDRTRSFTSAELPFELTFSHWAKNCRPLPKGPMWESKGPVIDGWALRPQEPFVEAEANNAGVYVSARDSATGNETQGLLWGWENFPWTFESGGREWAVTLRHKRYTMPFEIRLEDFTKEDHPRTMMAKSYMSDVTKVEDGGEQLIRIQMNEPLRHGGLVLFQASWGPEDARPGDPLYSVFAVVRNPSDYWPLWSCIIISIGLLMAFGQKLYAYVRSQSKARRKELARAS